MAEPFEFAGARLGHAAHASAGIDPGNILSMAIVA